MFSEIVAKELRSNAAAKKWVKKNHSFEDVIRVSSELREKLIHAIDAVNSMKNPEKQIAEEFVNVFHQRIRTNLTFFWDQNHIHKTNDKNNLLSLIQWTEKYHLKAEEYGVSDQRFTNGAATIS